MPTAPRLRALPIMKMTVGTVAFVRLKERISGVSRHSAPRPPARKSRNSRRNSVQRRQAIPQDLKKFVVTPYGRRRVSWRKGRVVASVVALLAAAGSVIWIFV